MAKIKLYGKVYGESMSSSEVDDVAEAIIKDYQDKKIDYGLAMRRVNFLYINTYSANWKSKYHGDIEQLREMLTSKKNKLRRLAGR